MNQYARQKEEMASRLTIDSIAELCDREGVENINIFDDSKTYKSIDSIVYSYDGKRLLKCPRGKTGQVTLHKGTEINCSQCVQALPYRFRVLPVNADSA